MIKEALEEIRGHNTPQEKEKRAQYIKDFKKKIEGNKNLLRIKKEIAAFTKEFPVPGIE